MNSQLSTLTGLVSSRASEGLSFKEFDRSSAVPFETLVFEHKRPILYIGDKRDMLGVAAHFIRRSPIAPQEIIEKIMVSYGPNGSSRLSPSPEAITRAYIDNQVAVYSLFDKYLREAGIDE